MAREQRERPITYSDVLDVKGQVGKQPVNKEEAALLQSLETMEFGRTLKGGTASTLQSAADHNIAIGAVRRDDHTPIVEQGTRIKQDPKPGKPAEKECVECVAGQPVAVAVMEDSAQGPSGDVAPVRSKYVPAESVPLRMEVKSVAPIANVLKTDKTLEVSAPNLSAPSSVVAVCTATSKPLTIGQALEAAAVSAGDSELDRVDVRAIESAESRATGRNLEKKGVAATAQSAVTTSERTGNAAATKVTLSDVLTGASEELPVDKIVTKKDAAKVMEAEKRGRPLTDLKPGGVAECMQVAAEMNKHM